MTRSERLLLHQIHPTKIATDVLAGILAVAAFAHGSFLVGMTAAMVIPAASSLAVLRSADLDRLKRSRLGAYVRKFMTPAAQVQRVAGFGILSASAWTHSYLLGVFGAALIVHAWTQGVLIPRDVRK